ncbi:MAG: hypothetical protein IH599_10210 [Bacteroidales bacterium]|nr:hypothetical protein [Bacteroidales bacterium]
MLETYRLTVDSIIHIPDIGRTVIEARIGRDVIEPGEMIPRGSAIILVMGSGSGQDSGIPVPMLLGKSRSEALRLLASSLLLSGEETYPDHGDTSDLVVFRQYPPVRSGSRVSLGMPVDLWYVARKDFNMNEALRQLGQDTLGADDPQGNRGNADSSLLEF